jgi:hypothetical protein
MAESHDLPAITESLQACDASESALIPASHFLEAVYEPQPSRSRAATPMIVRQNTLPPPSPMSSPERQMKTMNKWIPSSPLFSDKKTLIPGTFPESENPAKIPSRQSVRLVSEKQETLRLKER